MPSCTSHWQSYCHAAGRDVLLAQPDETQKLLQLSSPQQIILNHFVQQSLLHIPQYCQYVSRLLCIIAPERSSTDVLCALKQSTDVCCVPEQMIAHSVPHQMQTGFLSDRKYGASQANLYKTERDKLTRALAKEVGEEIPISRIVDGGGDWRGRAQQITLLKAKINDLQQAQVMPAAVTPRTGVSVLGCNTFTAYCP